MDERVCPDPLFDRLRRLAALGGTGRGKTDAITIDVSRLRRAFPTLPQGVRAVIEDFVQSVGAALDSRPEETGHPATEKECPMEHDELLANQNLGIPYPFNNLPPADEPLTDLLLGDTLEPILTQITALAEVLRDANLDNVSLEQLHPVFVLLAAQASASQTIFRRWWNDREDD